MTLVISLKSKFSQIRILTSVTHLTLFSSGAEPVTPTLCPCLDVICLHHSTGSLFSFSPDVVAVFSTMVHICVPVFRLWADLAQLLPAVPANLLTFQDEVRDRRTSIVFGEPPFELNAGWWTFNDVHRAQGCCWFIYWVEENCSCQCRVFCLG